jgi:opacity protein-like surface antigen
VVGADSGGPTISGAGLALAGAFALALASPAQALDLNGGEAVKDESGASEASKWEGFYVEGQSADVWPAAEPDLSQASPALPPDEVIRSPIWHGGGLTGSARAGYNWGEGQVVYGLERELSSDRQMDYLASVRGRIGLVSDSWLFYGTGGAAFLTLGRSGEPALESAAPNFDIGKSQTGLVAGGGVEAKLGPGLTMGVEGLYYGFEAGGSPAKDAGAASGSENLADVTVIKGRLTLRLNGEPGPLR